jgi:hypothetical protein
LRVLPCEELRDARAQLLVTPVFVSLDRPLGRLLRSHKLDDATSDDLCGNAMQITLHRMFEDRPLEVVGGEGREFAIPVINTARQESLDPFLPGEGNMWSFIEQKALLNAKRRGMPARMPAGFIDHAIEVAQ